MNHLFINSILFFHSRLSTCFQYLPYFVDNSIDKCSPELFTQTKMNNSKSVLAGRHPHAIAIIVIAPHETRMIYSTAIRHSALHCTLALLAWCGEVHRKKKVRRDCTRNELHHQRRIVSEDGCNTDRSTPTYLLLYDDRKKKPCAVNL